MGLRDANAALGRFLDAEVANGAVPDLIDCHLTEIRSKCGVEYANALRDRIFDGLFSSCISLRPTLVAAVNEAKRRVDQPERTYRTMLLDLLALVEAGLGDSEVISTLDIVVATRTKNGRRLTTLADITEQLRDTLPSQVEVGLASRGILQAFRSNALRLELSSASTLWGLVVADFIANTLYNRSHPEHERAIEALKREGKLSVFESFGGYEERRARVAERDGDRVAAIGRWAAMSGDGQRLAHARTQALVRLWRDLLRDTGTTGPFASLESVLEWLMRRKLGTVELLDAIAAIEDALTEVCSSDVHGLSKRLLYRVRNFRLRNLNHVGRCDQADRLIDLQGDSLPYLQNWPEMLPHVLDFSAIAVESAINKLDFSTALSRASDHLKQVNEYMAVWELLARQSSAKTKSRWYVRAASAFVRAQTLASEISSNPIDLEITALLAELQAMDLHPNERTRIQSYQLLSLLHVGQIGEALFEAQRMLMSTELDEFGLLWISRAVGDSLFSGMPTPLDSVVLAKLRERTSTASIDHPSDLLWRERAVLEYFVANDRKSCRSSLERCMEIIAAQDLQAPIGAWLRGVAAMHRDALLGSLASVESYFLGRFERECHSVLCGKGSIHKPFDSVLLCRRLSPD